VCNLISPHANHAQAFFLATFALLSKRAVGAKRSPLLIIFAIVGMAASLVIMFAIAQEVVALMSSLAAWLHLSPSFIGMLAVGIGNGSSDLVANYLVAKRGWPRIALSATFGGAVLNTLLGTAACTILGIVKFES
jgi:sodium/potassium/calcium exchanger 6